MGTESAKQRAIMRRVDFTRLKSGRSKFRIQFRATDWFADIDARDWLGRVMDVVLKHISDRIKAGVKPGGGGKQPELGDWIYTDDAQTNLRRDAKRRKSLNRGYATGELARNLTRTKISGNAGRARCKVTAPDSRKFFFSQEQKRGIIYLVAGGDVLKVALREAEAHIQEAVDAGKGTFDTASLAAARKARNVRKRGRRRPGGLARRGSRRAL